MCEFVSFHQLSVESTGWTICLCCIHAFVTTLEIHTHFTGGAWCHLSVCHITLVDIYATELVSVVSENITCEHYISIRLLKHL